MQEVYFYTGLILYLILIVVTLVISFFFFQKTRFNSKQRGKFDGYHFLIAIFFLIQFFSFIVRFYFMFIYPSNMTVFIDAFRDPAFRAAHLDYEKLVAIHIMLIFLGFGTLTLAIEHYIYKRTRHLLCILIYITAPILVILPYNLAVLLQNVPIFTAIFSMLIMIGFYANLARKSSGTIRWKAIYITIGFLLFFMGIVMNSQSIMLALHLYTLHLVWLSPIWFMLALLILFYGYKKELTQTKDNNSQ
jgi:hypothetical protein